MGARGLEPIDVIHLPTTGIEATLRHLRLWQDATLRAVVVDPGVELDAERLEWIRGTPIATPSAEAMAEAQQAARHFVATTPPGTPPDLMRCAELVVRVYLDDAARRLERGDAGSLSPASAARKRALGQPAVFGIATGTTLNALRDAQPRARPLR